MTTALLALYLLGGGFTACKAAADVRPTDGYDWLSVGLVAVVWPAIFLAAVTETILRAMK